MGALVLSANAVIVHWEKSEPRVKKSDWNAVALALTMMKPPSPAQHKWESLEVGAAALQTAQCSEKAC